MESELLAVPRSTALHWERMLLHVVSALLDRGISAHCEARNHSSDSGLKSEHDPVTNLRRCIDIVHVFGDCLELKKLLRLLCGTTDNGNSSEKEQELIRGKLICDER